ncbi:MAG: RNA degradosome polyphosphate kinase [Puniceicoccales bacterium]|jgi:polyphosphate kinase|nr:RNA degradosome polyphosphate kinase [Puniceicoccales bacterium]
MKTKFLCDPRISWMHFNHRVLQEAASPDVPLIERMRFLGIYSNNLDEFYRIRVATLRRLTQLGPAQGGQPDHRAQPRKVLKRIRQLVLDQQEAFERIYAGILCELEKQKIRLLDETNLNAGQEDFLRRFFHEKLANSLFPVILDKRRNFPPLADASIHLAVDFAEKERKGRRYALVEIPTNDFPRFIPLPNDGDIQCLILLDDVLRFNLPALFSSLLCGDFSAHTIKISRDADLSLDQDLDGGLLEKIQRGIKKRRRGNAVRLVHDRDLPPPLLKFILKRLKFDAADTIQPGGRYHNFKDFMKFPDLGRNDLLYPPSKPSCAPLIDQAGSMLEFARKSDFCLHYPYHSFSYFLRLLREAALDPEVESIQLTMYRLAGDSRVVRSMINAAHNGKRVTAVVELFARFDESANVDWAQRMSEAGIHVIPGVDGLKIHAKLLHIKCRKSRDVVCVSTGNFHEGNARVYTDFALFTADPRITGEVARVFDFINQPFHAPHFRHLLVSPLQMRKRLIALVQREKAFAQAGHPARIIGKTNHLADQKLLESLRDAGESGVKIQLVVRGNCALIPEKCKNIELTSIVDGNLEHSRLFLFHNGGNEVGYIGSADWMTRNFDGRVEVAAPIYNPQILRELKTILEYALKDNVKARIIDENGENRLKTPARRARRFRSQEELRLHYQRRAERENEVIRNRTSTTSEPATETPISVE